MSSMPFMGGRPGGTNHSQDHKVADKIITEVDNFKRSKVADKIITEVDNTSTSFLNSFPNWVNKLLPVVNLLISSLVLWICWIFLTSSLNLPELSYFDIFFLHIFFKFLGNNKFSKK